LAPIEFYPSSKNTDDDKDIRRVRKGTNVVDVKDFERCVRRGDKMVDVDGDANAVHLLATCALTDERLYVLAHVLPVVIQADQLGHGAVGTAVPHKGIVTHLVRFELVIGSQRYCAERR
jgi:hypothetical protein